MSLPLPNYLSVADGTIPNLSLKYYKWADVYEANFTKIKKDKTDFFKSFVNLSKNKAYRDAFETRKRLMEGIGITFTMTTVSRLVFGMGYEHPTEIGFTFDWTSGLPIIPGSSLKGAARYAAETEKHDCVNEIFGAEEGDAQAGEIVFFPAYPCLIDNDKPFLELDVMTPHYSEYYSDPEKNPPADWYSPVPLHFLTVPAGVKYCFRLAHRKDLRDKESPLLKKAENILKCALSEFGVGAKTSVFYGYFK
ncbi:MAG: type III-B CRISPR module RAMP protein Cmr6 [Candidatus Omnitrophica bacterium]|nr:type III-B CRISPR module RAMP protein Cmr6 [Candidatus Omnitrophota bacterium]